MVLTFLIAFGSVVGTTEGLRASQQKARREEHRSRKNNLIVHCPKSSEYSHLLEGRRAVLSGGKLYIDTGTVHDAPFGHPFEGYYLPYPDAKYAGLVSTITHEAPIMNWVYVDRETYEVKFGNRQASEGNFTGPYDCTRQDKRLTFGGWEGFVAVKEGDFWGLYFDRDNDKLRSKVPEGTPVIELELFRKELRTAKPEPPPPPPAPQQQEKGGDGENGTNEVKGEEPVDGGTEEQQHSEAGKPETEDGSQTHSQGHQSRRRSRNRKSRSARQSHVFFEDELPPAPDVD